MAGIAVVGNRDFVLGFKLAGIRDTFIEDKIDERVNSLLMEKKVSVIVLQDTEYEKLSQDLKRKFSKSMEPVVVPVGKLGEEDVREKIKRAIGIDLYKT
ncbi:MAG: V-type ATP synthase subunit F [Euryarchaeota archaeon]|jgi:V/A-type H+-transporting ATPase subunit F|nr:V-type ATP synthase subunit F [Euryarchaeota archaeon]